MAESKVCASRPALLAICRQIENSATRPGPGMPRACWIGIYPASSGSAIGFTACTLRNAVPEMGVRG